jgi:hypothetical protein
VKIFDENCYSWEFIFRFDSGIWREAGGEAVRR